MTTDSYVVSTTELEQLRKFLDEHPIRGIRVISLGEASFVGELPPREDVPVVKLESEVAGTRPPP